MTDDLYKEFCAWAARILGSHSNVPVAAYNFNLYEQETAFGVQLIGAKSFDLNNPDWPCNEAFSSGEDLHLIPSESNSWRKAQRLAKALIEAYLQTGAYAEQLKATRAVAIGFVDGDLEYLHLKPTPQ